MPLWFIYAILGAVFASLVSIFTKLGVTNISPSLAGTIKAIIMAIFFIIISSFNGDFTKLSGITNYKKDLLFLVLTGIFGALSWLFMNFAFKHGSVTKVVPIDKMSIAITILLSALILKEHLSAKTIIGVAFIVIGGIVIALH
ncbi:EamA family transporter [Clostridium thermobutyricum]|uniref:EamA-like transporter family protein n=1 Tax=Clostridium thermobutyricum DSM 4928 TaxID=1121339 RepID=A0A1V4SUE5_9CLOT|nr:EamA family transporter [Clostridium thermobutyricum]OPX47075.1 EamA-like transporter family protein [Clostridium thermobutyricum DSM 4928]